jgi:hypothetical protein
VDVSREILVASSEQGRSGRYALDVVEEGDHWMSTLTKLDERGEPESDAVAPRFYGLTREQARRRMIQVLENEYDSVASVAETVAR